MYICISDYFYFPFFTFAKWYPEIVVNLYIILKAYNICSLRVVSNKNNLLNKTIQFTL